MNRNSEQFHRICWNIMSRLVNLFQLFVCMVFSEYLLHNIILGGAVCLMGQVWIVYIQLYRNDGHLLPRELKAQGLFLFVAAIALNVLLLLVYPAVVRQKAFWPFLGLILLFLLQSAATELLAGRKNCARFLEAVGLFVLHIVFTAGELLLLSRFISNDNLTTCAWLLGGFVAVTLTLQIAVPPAWTPRQAKVSSAPPAEFPKGTTFQLYNRMSASLFVALNIALLCYACYIRFLPSLSPVQGLLLMAAWLCFVGLLTYLSFLFLKRKAFTKYDKPSLFAFGAFLWLVATIIEYRGFLSIGLIHTLVTNVLWGAGLACMLSIIISLGNDMHQVIRLGLAPADEARYARNTEAVIQWCLLLSSLLVLLILTVSSFFVDGKLDRVDQLVGMKDFMRTVMLVLPFVFVGAALCYALMQPLDKNYLKKLELYQQQKDHGDEDSSLRNRLEQVLLHTKKVLSYRFLRIILRPFFPCKVIQDVPVDTDKGPVIFVCNHLEVYGPIVSNLYLPYYARPWIIANMLDRALIETHLVPGVDKVCRFLPKKLRASLPSLISPLVVHIMQATDPIPVYRGGGKAVLTTIRLTVEAMELADNVLLFPENTSAEGETGVYKTEGVSAFYTGFCAIAEQYYKRTKQRTSFYPIYVDKHKHTLTIGKGIQYDPQSPKSTERTRIAGYLHDWMLQEGSKEQ